MLALVKICGVTSREDALMAEAMGARYIGMVLAKSGLRAVDTGLIRSTAEILSRSTLVAVIADETYLGDRYLEALENIDVVQVHIDPVPGVYIERLSRYGYRVVPVVIPRGGAGYIGERIDSLKKYSRDIEFVLIDAPKDSIAYSQYGGLRISPELYQYGCARYRPCGVAGGITPENVLYLRQVSPDVIDVSSGVETTPGRKDPVKVRRLVEVASYI